MDPILHGTDVLHERRQELHSRNDCCFLEPIEFVCRATSRHAYTRANDPLAALSGLFDAQTGVLFLVENEKLGRAAAF